MMKYARKMRDVKLLCRLQKNDKWLRFLENAVRAGSEHADRAAWLHQGTDGNCGRAIELEGAYTGRLCHFAHLVLILMS